MKDPNKISDEELDKMLLETSAPAAPPSAENIPDADLDQMLLETAPQEAQGRPVWNPQAHTMEFPNEKAEAGEAFTMSMADSATSGYLPHIQARAGQAMNAIWGDPFAEGDAAVRKQIPDATIQNPDQGYIAERDRNIAELQRVKNGSKVASGLGVLAGGALQGAGLAGPAGKLFGPVTGWASGLGQGAAMGALQGYVANPGDTEGEMSGPQLDERARSSVYGAGWGGALGGVFGKLLPAAKGGPEVPAANVEGIGPSGQAVTQASEELAEEMALNAAKERATKALDTKPPSVPQKAGSQVIRQKDADHMLAVAEEMGLVADDTLRAVEYGEHSWPNSLQKQLRETPGRKGDIANHVYDQNLAKANQAILNMPEMIAGTDPVTSGVAGDTIKYGLKEMKKNVFGNLDLTYNKFNEQFPDSMLNDVELSGLQKGLSEIQAEVDELISAGADGLEPVIKKLEGLKNNKGSIKQLNRSREAIGKMVTNSKKHGAIPIDEKLANSLHALTKDTQLNAIKRIGGDVAYDALTQANETISTFNKTMNDLNIDLDDASEKIVASLIEKGDTKRMSAFLSSVPEDVANQFRAQYLQSLIHKSGDGKVQIQKTLSNLSNSKKQDVMNLLFKKGDIAKLYDYVSVLQRMGARNISTSGTGKSISYQAANKVPIIGELLAPRAGAAESSFQNLRFKSQVAPGPTRKAFEGLTQKNIAPSMGGNALGTISRENRRKEK